MGDQSIIGKTEEGRTIECGPYTSATRPALGLLPSVALSSVRVMDKKHTNTDSASIFNKFRLLNRSETGNFNCRSRKKIIVVDQLPPGFARLEAYKDISGLKSSELMGEHPKTMDPTTRREYLVLTRSLFTYALENQYIESNPVISGIIPPKKKKAREQREALTMGDLSRIFNPETYLKWTEGRPERFYIPLLLLYTGCRLEEVASLYCADVFKTEDGLWCIEVNDKHDRKVKNQNAIRTVPLHPILVDQFKFPEYVQGVNHARVFPELRPVNFKYGHEFSKRFSYYLRNKVGITNKKKSLHSLRHTVTDFLYKHLVMESMIEELTGRAGKTETRNRYSKGYRAKELYEEGILKLDYGVDLSGLEASPLIVWR